MSLLLHLGVTFPDGKAKHGLITDKIRGKCVSGSVTWHMVVVAEGKLLPLQTRAAPAAVGL